MLNFMYYNPTRIFFGKGQMEKLGSEIKKISSKILLVYGHGSIKKNGIYDAVISQLNDNEIAFEELSGIDPNPRLSTVVKGADMCREHGLDFILAVGGGSVIDAVKGIAAVAKYDGDPWDFWSYKTQVKEALPFASVLTLSATGSEMNNGTVVTNEETEQKHGMSGEPLFPQFSILDPDYTSTVSKYQTAAGTADIMTHVYEFYFSQESAYLQDSMAEAVMRTCVKFGPIACEDPEDYDARANLMWASSMALNGTVARGKTFDGFNHSIEHGISAIYDLTHGVGLAILAVHWMDCILSDETVSKQAAFARNVFFVSEEDDYAAAKEGITRLKTFYRSMGLPLQLSEENIPSDRFDDIIEKGMGESIGKFKELNREDVRKILEMAK